MLASELLGSTVPQLGPQPAGRIADLLIRPDPDGRLTLHTAVIAPKRWGRLLGGYERGGGHGPWLIARLARSLHRHVSEVPWDQLPRDRLERPQ